MAGHHLWLPLPMVPYLGHVTTRQNASSFRFLCGTVLYSGDYGTVLHSQVSGRFEESKVRRFPFGLPGSTARFAIQFNP